MTPEDIQREHDADLQEALSRKYTAPMVLQLYSGRYALFGVDRRLLVIDTWDRIQYQVNTYIPPAEVKAQPRTKPRTLTVTLSLEDLDL